MDGENPHNIIAVKTETNNELEQKWKTNRYAKLS